VNSLGKKHDSTGMFVSLRASKLFAGMSDAIAEECIGHFTLVRAQRRRQLFRQGDACTQLYSVISGLVHIERLTEDGDEFTVSVVGRGDVFGAESLFDEAVHSRSATALNDCTVAVCRADTVKALCMRYPLLGLNIARCLQERHDGALKRIQRIALSRSANHLLMLLRELAVECGVREACGTRLEVVLTHTQLASLIGTTRETVSYELGKLERNGHLLRRGRTIVIPSSPGTAA
jgi:CRP/FNR family transcriptional regulator, cyclic AMP receptor protein